MNRSPVWPEVSREASAQVVAAARRDLFEVAPSEIIARLAKAMGWTPPHPVTG